MAPRSKLPFLALALSCVGRPDAAPPELGSTPSTPVPGAARELVPVAPGELRATSGEIIPDGPGRFTIRSPTLRAELGRQPRSAAELAFVYQGPTLEDAPLSSGELRRQIGLKLRASDTCNVVYVMWHIEPKPAIVVSVKNNPGQSRHAECGDRGYAFLDPAASEPAPPIEVGQKHVLRVELRGRDLIVSTDGRQSWSGALPDSAFEFDGPVGLRSDNGRFSAELRAEGLAP